MRDALAVRFLERVGDRDSDFQRFVERERPAPDPIRERLAFQVLHHEEVDVALLADVVQRADVRVIQRGDRLRFALEPVAPLRIVGEMRRQHFDRDRAVQSRVGCFVDLAHAAGAQRGDELVRSEFGAGLEWQLSPPIITDELDLSETISN